MTPHIQKFHHDPKNGVWGDCYRTAIACLLDIEPDKVPHVTDGDPDNHSDESVATKMMRDWLKPQGLYLVSIAIQADTKEQVMEMMQFNNPDIHYLLVGESVAGCNHNVICKGNKFIHCPSTGDVNCIVGPCDDGLFWIDFITKMI